MKENNTKQLILTTAYEMISCQGYDKTSIGQIADKVGIKKASIYYYFNSKEEIFIELVKLMYNSDATFIKEAMNEKINSKEEYLNNLIHMGELLIDSCYQDLCSKKFSAEVDIQTTRIPEIKSLISDLELNCVKLIEEYLTNGIKLGYLPEDTKIVNSAQLLYTIFIGIDSAILYDLPVNCIEVWKDVAKNIVYRKE